MSQVKGTIFLKITFTLDTSHKSEGPQNTITSDRLATNFSIPTTH